MTHRLVIRVHPDGRVESRTEGVYGTECLKDVVRLEELLDSVAVDSHYTQDRERVFEEQPEIDQVRLREQETDS